MSDQPRIINLGLPKSGTTTLAKALRSADYSVADWQVELDDPKPGEPARRFVGRLMYDGYFETGNPLDRLSKWDAFTEISVASRSKNLWPQTDYGLLKSIADRFSGARFLLSWRDPKSQYDSMMRWTNLGSIRLPRFQVPGMPAGYGKTEDEICRWINGHGDFCRKVFANDPRFLEFGIHDPLAPEKISNFLGRDIKWWGKSNTNDASVAASANDQVDP